MFDFLSKYFLIPGKFYSLFDILMIATIIMALLLKIVAAKRAWKNDQKVWFWFIIFVNTLGILEMIYLCTNKDETVVVPESKKEDYIKEEIVDLSASNEPANYSDNKEDTK